MKKYLKGRNILVYACVVLSLVILRIAVFFLADFVSFFQYYLINLIVPIIILSVANGVIHYVSVAKLKNILIHSLALGVIFLCINLIANQFYGDRIFEKMSSNIMGEADVPSAEDLYDDAMQAMIEQGLIGEDDEIVTSGEIIAPDQNIIIGDQIPSNSGYVATLDVQVVEETPLSMITGILVDIFFAFCGGVIGGKLFTFRRRTATA